MIASWILLCMSLLTSLIADSALCADVAPTSVGTTKELVVKVDFHAKITSTPDPSKYWLGAPGGEKVYCTSSTVIGKSKTRIGFVFQITPANEAVFEKLVWDSSGYYLSNDEPIVTESSEVAQGELKNLTRDGIGRISQNDWNQYVMDAYAANYLFPPELNIGRNLSFEDSNKTIYNIEFAHSDAYLYSSDWHVFWGMKGRWSTDGNDRLNFAQLYPLILLHASPTLKFDAMAGVETGYLGFSKQGRALTKGELRYRLPYNPLDFTFGTPRVRIKPVLDLSFQGNWAWSDESLPDSLKRSADISADIRYDIPVGARYYLRSSVGADYTTTSKQLLYQYDLSLGYIVDGTIHIAAEYRQGYQAVSYQFDKQLLIGIGLELFDVRTPNK